MPLTVIYLLSATPNQTSPLSTILSHITLTYQCTSLPPFNVTHHLYTSTSSLLPDPEPWPPAPYNRPFLSVLTLSNQNPNSGSAPTFLTTSHPNPVPSNIESPGPVPTYNRPDSVESKGLVDREQKAQLTYEKDKAEYDRKLQRCTTAALAALKYSVTSVTIPSSDAGTFMDMLNHKMTPLWSLRGTERINDGTAIALRDDDWILRIGELRQETRKAGTSSFALRGVLCEITWISADGKVGDKPTADAKGNVKDFLDKLLQGTGMKFDGARSVAGYSAASNDPGNEPNWALAELYTELLRTRG